MKIDKRDIEYIANLSRIELSESEKEMFVHQLGDILTYIEKLNELNTEDTKPMINTMNAYNIFREDKLVPSISHEEATSSAPVSMGAFFKVPKVIDLD